VTRLRPALGGRGVVLYHVTARILFWRRQSRRHRRLATSAASVWRHDLTTPTAATHARSDDHYIPLEFYYNELLLTLAIGCALDRVHNRRLPLDRLFAFNKTVLRGCVVLRRWPLTFELIFIDGRGIVMDYPCAKFGDCTFSRFGFIVRTDRQTQRQNHRITDADDWFSSYFTFGPKEALELHPFRPSGQWCCELVIV